MLRLSAKDAQRLMGSSYKAPKKKKARMPEDQFQAALAFRAGAGCWHELVWKAGRVFCAAGTCKE